jgi:hypothetical protein
MAGLVPAIHVLEASKKQDVDARHKAGHDESVEPMTRTNQTERDHVHAQ